MELLQGIFNFISDEVLGMHWLNNLIGHLLSSLGVDLHSKLGGSLQFFIYDMLKIVSLLVIMIFIISYIQSYFPPERTRSILGRYHGWVANIMGALLGTVTPFCSCSSIPLFIGFTSAGLPVGVTFSFLISSPLTDLGAFILLTSIFGFEVALLYVVVGIILAVIGGSIIDKLNLPNQTVNCIKIDRLDNIEGPKLSRKQRVDYAKLQTTDTLKRVFIYIVVGVFIGALIHNWIPVDLIQSLLGQENPFSVLLATLVGIPMYGDVFGAIPISQALYLKGVGLGTVLSFMMAVTALSLPSIIMLKRVVKTKLLVIFVSIVTLGIMIIGYAFNIVGGLF